MIICVDTIICLKVQRLPLMLLKKETLKVIPKAAMTILESVENILDRPYLSKDQGGLCQLLSLAILLEETKQTDLAHVVIPFSDLENVHQVI